MTISVLTCISEDGTIIDQLGYTNIESARKSMRDSFERELEGLDKDLIGYASCDEFGAIITYGEGFRYEWSIRNVNIV